MFLHLISFFLLRIPYVLSWCRQSYLINAGEEVTKIDYSPNRQYIVAGLKTKTNVYFNANRSLLCSYNHASVNFGSIRVFPSNDKFAFAIDSPTLKIISISNCSVINTLSTSHTKINGLDFSLDGTKMVTCGDDKKFRVWDITTSGVPTLIGGNFDTGYVIWSCKFSFDNYIMIGNSNNEVRIYGPNFGNTIFSQKSFTNSGNAENIDFYHCEKTRFIMGSSNARGYGSNSTNEFLTTTSHIRLGQVDPTNRFIAFGNQNNELKLVDTSNYSKIQSFTVPQKIFCGKFISSGQILMVGLKDTTILFYKRCGCASDSASYNSSYCPIQAPIDQTCLSQSNITNTVNTTEPANNTNITNTPDSTNNTNITNTPDPANNTNITNTTDSKNITNSSNDQNNTIQPNNSINNNNLDSLTPIQFFTTFFKFWMILELNEDSSFQSRTFLSSNCNQLITKVKFPVEKCQNYYSLQDYIKIIHPSLNQKRVYCQQEFLIIISVIEADIENPKDIFLLFPSTKLLGSPTSAKISQWANNLVKSSAGYDEVVLTGLYKPDQCAQSQKIPGYLNVVLILSGVMLILGLVSAKIVGLQLFGVLQISYFNLANHQTLNINLFPLIEFSKSNGFNLNIFQQKQTQMPEIVKRMGINSQFLNNFNLMGFSSLLIILIAFIVYKISLKLSTNYSSRILVFLKQCTVTLALFNSFNIAYSAGIHFRYSHNGTFFHVVSTLAAVLFMVSLLIVAILLQLLQEYEFGEFKLKFKASEVNRSYVSFLLVYRMFIGFYLAYTNQEWQTTIYVVGFSMFFMLYFIINLPYEQYLHNYRSGAIHLITMIILFVANYYRSIKMNVSVNIKSHLHDPALLELGVIGVSLAVSIIGFLYQIFIQIKSWIRKRDQQKKVNQQISLTGQNITEQNI